MTTALRGVKARATTNQHQRITAGSEALQAVLLVGATARLTRLVNADTITQPVRDWVRYQPHQRAALAADETDMPAPTSPDEARRRAAVHDFLTCPWCVGMWLALGLSVTAGLVGHTRTYRLVAGALATSYAVGVLAAHEE